MQSRIQRGNRGNSRTTLFTTALAIAFAGMMGACGGMDDSGLADSLSGASSFGNRDICHFTGSTTNPWLVITVNQSSIRQHMDHHGDFYAVDGYSCEEAAAANYGPDLVPPPELGNDCLTFPENPGCTPDGEALQAAREYLAAKAAEAAAAAAAGGPVAASAACEGWGMVFVDRQHCEVGQAVVLVYGNFKEHPVLTGPEGDCDQAGIRTEADGTVRYAFICNYLDNEAPSYRFVASVDGYSCSELTVESGCGPS